MTIERKSEPLTDCVIEVKDKTTKNGEVEIYLNAKDKKQMSGESLMHFG